MNDLNDVAELLQNKETINLALQLICKEYNFRAIKEVKYNHTFLGITEAECIFITKYNLETEQQLMHNSISKFKKDVSWQRSSSTLTLGTMKCRTHTKSGHEKIKILWIVKK